MNGHNEWLLIGSVVLMDGGSRAVTITGCMLREESGELWDYIGVPHPQGWSGPSSLMVFNRGDIARVVALGYMDPDGDRFLAELDAHDEEWRQHRADAVIARGGVDAGQGADA